MEIIITPGEVTLPEDPTKVIRPKVKDPQTPEIEPQKKRSELDIWTNTQLTQEK